MVYILNNTQRHACYTYTSEAGWLNCYKLGENFLIGSLVWQCGGSKSACANDLTMCSNVMSNM